MAYPNTNVGKNPYPRQGSGSTQTPDAADQRFATGWGKDRFAGGEIGEIHGQHPTLRGVEPNTSDGRTSRQPSSAHIDTSPNPEGTVVDHPDQALETYVTQGYGTQDQGCVHTQGGLETGMGYGTPTESFND